MPTAQTATIWRAISRGTETKPGVLFWRAAVVTTAALMISACATDRLEDLSYWWNAKVNSVGPAAQLPAGVDRSCIPPASGGSISDDRLAIVVTYRVGKASITKAYLELAGTSWSAGDNALVHPETCRIKHPPVRTI